MAKHKPFNPLLDITAEYYKYPMQNIIIPASKNIKEFAVSDFTLLPLFVYDRGKRKSGHQRDIEHLSKLVTRKKKYEKYQATFSGR